nr:cytochrome C [Clostridiales bacterium]
MTITSSIPGTEDAHGRLTLTFVTESGYTGTFATLLIAVAPITLLAPDAMTGATAISFFAPAE